MIQLGWIKNVLQLLTFVICIIVFLWQILDLSSSYFEGHEAVSQENKLWESMLPVPVLYFCLQNAFKNNTLQHGLSKESYFEHAKTFNISASILIFQNYTTSELNDKLSFVPFWENGLCAKFRTEDKISVGSWLHFRIEPEFSSSNGSANEVKNTSVSLFEKIYLNLMVTGDLCDDCSRWI